MEALSERPDIVHAVESVAKDHGIENWTITSAQTNEQGEGMMSTIFTIVVKDTNNNKQINFVIKVASTDDQVRDNDPIENLFLNEIYFYTTIYPTFGKLECDNGEPLQIIPECYKTVSTNKKELLCLENLKALGFETFDKKLSVDDDHIKIIFKTYGRFHAYSYALKDQKPEEYERISSNLHNVFYEFLNHPNGQVKGYLTELSKTIQECFAPGKDDEILEKYSKYVNEGVVSQVMKVVTEACDCSAILHGDCWSNNMLFKYETSEGGKKPVEMRLLDLQVVKIGSPACDLSYCLYSGASKAVFDNLNEYLRIYHESFSSFLKKLGSDPGKMFPFDVLKEHWKKYARFGMIMSFGFIKLKATNQDDFVKRVRELLYHMSEIDAL